MLDEEKLVELLVRRDDLLEQGHDATPEEVCVECPELIEEYKARVESLKRTDFLFETDNDEDDESLTLPETRTAQLRESELPSTLLSIEQFLHAITQNGLMTEEEVESFQQSVSTEVSSDTPSVARELVHRKKLTLYQASVLLAERSDPLLLDRYIILDTIDSGGMGLVFKALHRSLDRIVALKTLPPTAVDSEEKVKRFQREARTAAKLTHPNIVTTHDAHESNGIHFLVMEYVKGKDLGKVVKANGPLPVGTAVNYILQAARGLEHAHAQGIIHRDIKPGNLLLDTDGSVKVLDLGLARLETATDAGAETQEDLTAAGGVMGTAAYMSPEQAANTHDADARSDIYSLGCTLFYLLTGKPPYKENSLVNTILAHRDKPIPPLSEGRDDVPEELIVVYRRMMAKKPEDRFQSMTEVIEALGGCATVQEEPVATEEPEIVEEPTPVPKQEARPSSGGRSWWWAIAGVVVIGLLAPFLLSVVVRIKTPDGTLVVEISEPDAIVEVLDEKNGLEIKRNGGKGDLTISVDPGKHRLKVEKEGFKLFTEAFEIESGGEKVIAAHLEPLPESLVAATEPALTAIEKKAEQAVELLTEHSPIQSQQPAPEAKLIDHARWTFDEGEGNVARDSGKGRGGFHGVLKNMAPEDAWSEDVPPTKTPNRYSLKFDGTDDYIEVAPPPTIWAKGTFAAWIKTDNAIAERGLIGTRNGDYRNRFNIAINDSGWREGAGDIRVWLIDSDGRTFRRYTRHKTDICDGRWHHLGVVWNGTTMDLRILVDGIRQDVVWIDEGSKGAPYNYQPFNFPLHIGHMNWEPEDIPGGGIDGLMDDVHLFGRDLSDPEIQELAARRDESEAEMSQPVPDTALDSPSPEPNPAGENKADIRNKPQQAVPEAKLIDHARWTFDEGEGNVAKDSGNGRGGFNGVLKNMDPEDAWSEDVPPTKAPNRFSLKFDGVDDFVEVTAPMKLYAEGSFTAWIKTDNATDRMEVIGTGNRDWRSALKIDISGGCEEEGEVCLYMRDSDKRCFDRYSRPSTDLCDGRWHHVAVTWNGTTQTVRIYVDGVSQKVEKLGEGTGAPYNFKPFEIPLHIGDANWPRPLDSSRFAGLIDEVQLFSRELSGDEIQELAARSIGNAN